MAERAPEPETEAEEAMEQANPAAMALALGRSRSRGAVDARADAFLEEQTELIRLQKEHLHEQRELQFAHLKVRRWKDRMSLALQMLGVVVGAAAVVALGVMVWEAHEDHGLMVEAFSVPPDLAGKGLNGEVVASQLLDKLADMQAKTNSGRPARSYRNNWGDDLKVEIPETGVSLGELNRWLRQSLGAQTHISGEVFRTPAGLIVSVRDGDGGGARFSGPESDLDKLIQQAAESVYQRSQPYRYGQWLLGQGRDAEGLAAMTALTEGPVNEDRVWAEGNVGLDRIDHGDIAGGLDRVAEVERLEPGSAHTWAFASNVMGDLDHGEAALKGGERMVRLLRDGANGVAPAARQTWLANGQAAIAETLGDFRAARELDSQLDARLGASPAALAQDAFDDGLDHDGAAADAALARAAAGKQASANLPLLTLEADVALERWPAALQAGAATMAADASGPFLRTKELAPQVRRIGTAWYAYAKAMSGDVAGGKALIATTPLDCDTCLRVRGRIAAAEQDWPTAARWFAMVTRQAPSIPFAYADWGAMLLAKGDLDGAIAKLQLAHEKGPHYADALELWGEALMRKGDDAGAAAKFAEADKYAPHWDRNHAMWRQALAKAGGRG